MKKTKIRYKKIFICLLLLVLSVIGIGYAVTAMLSWLSASGAAGTEKAGSVRYCLFIGLSEGAPQKADSLILTSINEERQEMYVISLPGNTQIDGQNEKNLLLRDAYASGGTEGTISAVENLLHIRIDRYAVFDGMRFSSLIGRLGNTEMYVEEDMTHTDASGAEDISLRRGVQELSGADSYGYLRYIDPEEGEIGRIQREERFFKALFAQAQNHLRVYMWGLVRYYWSAAATNLTKEEAASAIYDMLGFPSENIHFVILPGEIRQDGGAAVWDINPVEIQKVVGLTIDQ